MPKFPAYDKAADELAGLRKGLADVMSEAGADYDMDKIKSVPGDRKAKVDWIREQNSQITKAKERVEELKEIHGIAAANQDEYFEQARENGDGAAADGRLGDGAKSLGRAFIESGAFKNYRGNGSIGPVDQVKGVALKTLFERGTGWDPESVRSGRVVLDAQRPAPHVVNYIPSTPVNSDAYKYMEETTFTNAAAETAEGAAYAEATLALTERTKIIEKVAVYLSVTDEQLQDEAAAEAYVNNRLTFMLQQRVDLQALQGNGTTPNILGTENVVGLSTQAKGADTIMDASYKLFTTIRSTAFAEPSVVFIQPSKWQEVMLAKTADGQYIWGHPATVGPQTLWGVPVVPTMAVSSTKLVTGDYSTHSLLGIRRGLDMQVTNAHSDYFIKGKQAIRADLRLVLVHFRPEAFGTVTGL